MGLNTQILSRGDDKVHFTWRCLSTDDPRSKDVLVQLFLADPNRPGDWMPVDFLERTESGSMSVELCHGEIHRLQLDSARALWAGLRNSGWQMPRTDRIDPV